ncbi:MAG: T9SS type A sorting domain-containing protein [Bacteroidota bacterium]
MKTQLCRSIFLVVATLASAALKAQVTATFENLILPPNSYWDGSSTPSGTTFASGDAVFPNFYDPSFGGYWASGWAYSNMKDSTTAGYLNMYSARTAIGYAGSSNYGIGKDGSIINFNSNAIAGVVNGVYITNTTYAALSIRDGDMFARKFGDTTGTNSGLAQGTYPDWFKLSITGYRGGNVITDTVNFYLADYRFANSAKDYIVTNWQWVDLISLGNVDSLIFNLSSSDNGLYGMNTPGFFAIDDFITASTATGIVSENKEVSLNVFPNPSSNQLTIDLSNVSESQVKVDVTDIQGKLMYSEIQNTGKSFHMNISNFENGIYFINISGENTSMNQKFIKQ